ncbi:molybdopterin synthase sulfur carrier subunit [Campylobacterota bacterium]|nr:molybdopterin synthase sulfur carrier subunit [Campylobacterota bacterium]
MKTVTVRIPAALRNFTGRKSEVIAKGETVLAVLRDLTESNPAIKPHIFDEAGEVRSFITLFLGETDVRQLQGNDTPLTDGATLTLVPAIAGGSY